MEAGWKDKFEIIASNLWADGVTSSLGNALVGKGVATASPRGEAGAELATFSWIVGPGATSTTDSWEGVVTKPTTPIAKIAKTTINKAIIPVLVIVYDFFTSFV